MLLLSCKPLSASTATPRDALGPAVVNEPFGSFNPVARYAADHGAVSPRSAPIARRRSWNRVVAPEGINRREEVNSFPLRTSASCSFPSPPRAQSLPPPSCSARAPLPHAAAVGQRARLTPGTPPPDDAPDAVDRHLPPHAIATVLHHRGKSPLLLSAFSVRLLVLLLLVMLHRRCGAPPVISSP